jgi:hypothetical protein
LTIIYSGLRKVQRLRAVKGLLIRTATIFTKPRFMISSATVLSNAFTALALTSYSTHSEGGSAIQSPTPVSTYGLDHIAAEPGANSRLRAVYFDPAPALFNAYTYGASVQFRSINVETRVAGRVHVPGFQRATKSFSANYFIEQHRSDAVRSVSSPRFRMSSVQSRHELLSKQKRSLISPQVGSITQMLC